MLGLFLLGHALNQFHEALGSWPLFSEISAFLCAEDMKTIMAVAAGTATAEVATAGEIEMSNSFLSYFLITELEFNADHVRKKFVRVHR